ncbi:hypothetical protein Q9R19_01050 [Microbacterium sp. ARD32]|uniref:hypothetical protein n=1 Tax=Microbacterium sp. ARD32 TaxID=2962577 RepID=UPI002881EED8|nr:hypothetical protein [Microbacterium sp. ARD32]MDT0156203.1 hypothetical protein [Microbacterium sp. ARD32]
MTFTRTGVRRFQRAPSSWALMLAATALTGGAIALVWLVAVPWGPMVCPAIYPAPRNCFASDRAGTALVSTVIVIVLYLATMATALVGRRVRALTIAGVVLLAAAAVVSHLAVVWILGFTL